MSVPGERRLGVFWGLRDAAGRYVPVGEFALTETVPLVGGFRTMDIGHCDLWPLIRRSRAGLAELEYDEVPRGRVNWREEDECFLVLLDRRLMTRSFLDQLFALLGLEADEVSILADPHYR